MGTKILTVKVPDWLSKKLYEIAGENGLAVSSIVRAGIMIMIAICKRDEYECKDITEFIDTLIYEEGEG